MTTTAAATAARTTPVVGSDQVSKSYGNVRAVDGLSLRLHPGETVALLGPNGAGRATTLGRPRCRGAATPSPRPLVPPW